MGFQVAAFRGLVVKQYARGSVVKRQHGRGSAVRQQHGRALEALHVERCLAEVVEAWACSIGAPVELLISGAQLA